jgi:membrane protease YdiL (CAAX protease family)
MSPFSAVDFAGIALKLLAAPPPTGITPFKAVPWWSALLNYPPVKALLPIPILLMIAPALYWFFRKTWYAVDEDAARQRQASGESQDFRPFVCFALTAVILTLQEYYGGRDFFSSTLRPVLEELEMGGQRWVRLETYDELYGYAWWVSSRVFGYVAVPIVVWKLLFPEDRILDMGLRVRGFIDHVWIYALCLVVVMGALVVVAQQPDFGTYYPFYKQSSRSWSDFLAWEAMYFLQFLGLEFFFRGWMLSALRRTLGASAIFAMSLPYCMIHYGKPYLETHGALVAGIVLGSLAMRTRSIYAGFLVHVTVAFSMDYLALARRSALPTTWFP